MTATAALALGAALAAVVLGTALVRTRGRLARVEVRVRRLEGAVEQLAPAVAQATNSARRAATAAREAAIAVGVPDPLPRLPLEPVTGPVVRAVAFGAGARRALARAASAPWSRRGPRALRRSA